MTRMIILLTYYDYILLLVIISLKLRRLTFLSIVISNPNYAPTLLTLLFFLLMIYF
jgi:hypothetical protein